MLPCPAAHLTLKCVKLNISCDAFSTCLQFEVAARVARGFCVSRIKLLMQEEKKNKQFFILCRQCERVCDRT